MTERYVMSRSLMENICDRWLPEWMQTGMTLHMPLGKILTKIADLSSPWRYDYFCCGPVIGERSLLKDICHVSNTYFFLLPECRHSLWFHLTPSHCVGGRSFMLRVKNKLSILPLTIWATWEGHLSSVALSFLLNKRIRQSGDGSWLTWFSQV